MRRLIRDIEGTELTDTDRRRLSHPACAGVILFARNYRNKRQLSRLTRDIHALRSPPLLIAVDQEGGRVRRFRDGFLALPPMRRFGELYDQDPAAALQAVEAGGWLMAAECLSVGVDFSFAPVLDLDYGDSDVIGDRAFHAAPEAVSALAGAWVRGMRQAGMAATGKHFPGHGCVAADSHKELPDDARSLADIRASDLRPFSAMIQAGVEGVMPGHVLYSRIDDRPAGFSPFWLQTILRQELGFGGIIFSDDLSMAGASTAGGPADRARAALDAGCDLLLVCNAPNAADEVLESLEEAGHASSDISILYPRRRFAIDTPEKSEAWKRRVGMMDSFLEEFNLNQNRY